MVDRFADADAAIAAATDILLQQIKGPTDLYLSGGSSFVVFEALDTKLGNDQKQSINLLQVDERYGAVGHPDSNWRLLDAIDINAYHSARAMLEAAKDAPAIAQAYSVAVERSLDSPAKKIAILGVGEDAHTAGVKPMSKSQYEEIFSGKLVAAYDWSDFSRLTLTLDALRRFDAVVAFMAGPKKASILDTLNDDHTEYESPIHGLIGMPNINLIFSEE